MADSIAVSQKQSPAADLIRRRAQCSASSFSTKQSSPFTVFSPVQIEFENKSAVDFGSRPYNVVNHTNPSYIFPKEAKKRSSSAERLPPSSLCLPAIDDRRGTAEVAPPPLRLRPLPSAFRLPSASRNRRPTDRSSTAEASVFALCHPPSSLCLPAIDHGPPKGHRRSMSTGNSSVPQNPHTLNSVVGESNENMNEVNEQAEGVERVGLHLDGHDTPLNEETETQQEFQTNKRKKTSGVWVDFEVVNVAGVQKLPVKHDEEVWVGHEKRESCAMESAAMPPCRHFRR
nr:zinc finger BED domain-containing protein RICESLEEPER 2-like [Ipomoea batatas]